VNGGKITRPDILSMIAQKSRPILTRILLAHLAYVALYRSFVHDYAQFEEFPMDLLPPQRRFSIAICLMRSTVSWGMRGLRLLGFDFRFQ
jgi:hypothetical protein